jgi:hydrogenase/urease accessory protein HupE
MIKIPYCFLVLSLSVGFLALGIWATESVGFDHSFKMFIGFLALIITGACVVLSGTCFASR